MNSFDVLHSVIFPPFSSLSPSLELSLAHAEELNAVTADSSARTEELESTHRSELIKLSERLKNDHNTQLVRVNDQAEAEKEELQRVGSLMGNGYYLMDLSMVVVVVALGGLLMVLIVFVTSNPSFLMFFLTLSQI